jgi:membrane protease subunit HflK
MYLDMMSQVMGNISKVMVDQKNGNSLLYLPLDKLIESSRASGAPVDIPAAAKPDAPVTSQGNDNNAAQRARDSLLTRDREARP